MYRSEYVPVTGKKWREPLIYKAFAKKPRGKSSLTRGRLEEVAEETIRPSDLHPEGYMQDEGEHTGEGRSPFGQLLREFRIAARLSQETLAERAGLSAGGISVLERGTRRAPHRDTVALLASALKTRMSS